MNNWYKVSSQFDDFNLSPFQDGEVSIKEHSHHDETDLSNVIKGLKKFVEDYKSAMDYGNIDLAMEIRDNIKKDMDLHNLPKNVRWEIWGENPDKI